MVYDTLGATGLDRLYHKSTDRKAVAFATHKMLCSILAAAGKPTEKFEEVYPNMNLAERPAFSHHRVGDADTDLWEDGCISIWTDGYYDIFSQTISSGEIIPSIALALDVLDSPNAMKMIKKSRKLSKVIRELILSYDEGVFGYYYGTSEFCDEEEEGERLQEALEDVYSLLKVAANGESIRHTYLVETFCEEFSSECAYWLSPDNVFELMQSIINMICYGCADYPYEMDVIKSVILQWYKLHKDDEIKDLVSEEVYGELDALYHLIHNPFGDTDKWDNEFAFYKTVTNGESDIFVIFTWDTDDNFSMDDVHPLWCEALERFHEILIPLYRARGVQSHTPGLFFYAFSAFKSSSSSTSIVIGNGV